jgi:hypothetical protein
MFEPCEGVGPTADIKSLFLTGCGVTVIDQVEIW